MSPICGLINTPNLNCYTRLNHECTQQDSIYLCKDSSSDSPISKNLMLTILASNARSNLTKVFKCPHTRNDSKFTHNDLII
ncbi:hypothetical protein H5410_062004 [Solanum commersonii]|uniref:Uncharacterized protein n=1 Tax=Solanum commersonii TaxID=4109 RepID=A0A9J5WBB8_SOLCO|nr:hypothetical protein H5410_062004 [Solanum commersonii]